MKKYVVGFAFSGDLTRVLLVKKLHPEWQKGYWNGVGGHIEVNETPHEAMVREFQEETGLATNVCDWECTVVIRVLDAGAIVTFFRIIAPFSVLYRVSGTKNDVGERLGLIPIGLPHSTAWLPNLDWLIPLQNQPLEFPIWVVEKKKGGFA